MVIFSTVAVSIATAAPVIECDPPVLDFGAQANTSVVEHVFLVWNRGDSLLEISRVIGCCGASTKLTSRTIQPGSNTTFAVTLSLQGRRNAVRKAIYLVSNDPTNAHCRIQITGTPVANTTVAPGQDGHTGTGVLPGVTDAASTGTVSRSVSGESSHKVVPIAYYHEPGCPDCTRVEQEVLPALQTQYEGFYAIRDFDLNVTSNLVALLELQKRHGVSPTNSVPVWMLVGTNHLLGGVAEISESLIPVVAACLSEPGARDMPPQRTQGGP
jgi:hypothetical protein